METKVQLKNLYLTAVIAIGLIGLGVGSTFAMFTASAAIDNPIAFNSNLSSTNLLAETVEVTVPAGEDKYVDLVISNTSGGNINYSTWYSPSSNGLEVGSSSSNNSYSSTGTIISADNFTLTVELRNNGDSPITVTIGLSSSGETIVLPGGVTVVPDQALPDISLYGVLKNHANNSEYADKYIGEHQDSMDATKSTKDIYYFYAENAEAGDTIRNKNNVVFGGQCWQMIRTTDTGGVKLLYNGEPTLGESNGKVTYDCSDTRPGHIGGIKSTQNLNGTYYYASSYTASVSNGTTTYTLTNPVSVEVNATNAASVIPQIVQNNPYTCKKNTSNGTCTDDSLYKIDSQSSGTIANVYSSTKYYDSIGLSSFDSNSRSPSGVGYMHNSIYTILDYRLSKTVKMLQDITLDSTNMSTYGSYYVGESYSKNNGNYYLSNPVIANTLANNPSSWAGKYMCDTSSTSYCTYFYEVVGVDTSGTNPVMYRASTSDEKDFDDSSFKYLFGDNLIDNGDGTFSLSGNVVEVAQNEWYSKYSTLNNKIVFLPGFYTYNSSTGANSCSDNRTDKDASAIGYVTSTSAYDFTYSPVYKYGLGIASDSGLYKLTGNSEQGTLQYIYNWPTSNTSNCFSDANDTVSDCGYNTISKSHYSCLNLSGRCSTYYYIYYVTNSIIYPLALSGGKYVSTDLTDNNNVLYEMFRKDNVNTVNSTIKDAIESWYENTLYDDFDNYIDDTVYCNNRSITSFSAFNPNGGSGSLKFAENGDTINLSCSSELDKFSVSNNSAKLGYKVGLFSKSELSLLGNNQSRVSSYYFWTISPVSVQGVYSYVSASDAGGNLRYPYNVGQKYGVRPSISLVDGIKYSSGNGSMTNPYVVNLKSVSN